MKLGFYKINGDAIADPTFATDGSACFDLRADLTNFNIKGFVGDSNPVFDEVTVTNDRRIFHFPNRPDIRWMIPTGLIFDIPTGFHIAVYMRGGTGLKRGLRLANGTGIVDDDYINETFILLQNISGCEFCIEHNERLCQAHLRQNVETNLVRLASAPLPKTERAGGFNSTGRM